MKTLILYYSYSGNAQRIAEALADKMSADGRSADVCPVRDKRRPGKLRAFSAGCFAALRGKAWRVQPLEADLAAYERLILLGPVWAGNPAPAFNAVLAQLPPGKAVAVKMVSSGGKSACKDRVGAVIQARGCVLEDFEDIKA